MQHKIQKLINNAAKCDKIQIFFVSLPTATSTRNRIMASTMSVDEYFDELIDKVREDYANL